MMEHNWFIELVEQSPDYLILLDKELKIVFINRVSSGLDKQDLIGVYAPVLTGKKMEMVEKMLMDVLETGQGVSYDTFYDDPYDIRHHLNNRAIKLERPIGQAVLYIVAQELSKKPLAN